jgi:hypothetical protein
MKRQTVIFAIAASASCSIGQTRDWLTAASGNWNTPANWSGTDVPNSAAETANIAVAGTYTVTFDLDASLGGMTMTNPNGTVNILAGRIMGVGGLTWTNNGLVVVNSIGANLTTQFRTDAAAATIGGTGTIRLNADAGNLDTAQVNTLNGGFLLTNSAGHRFAGTGRIRTAFANAGTVEADMAGRTLDLAQLNKTNTGTMRAMNGGTLLISGIGVGNTGGQISAEGTNSVVTVANSGLTGGTLTGTGGGRTTTAGNSAYADITLAGPHDIPGGNNFNLQGGGITNNGTLSVNPTGANLTTLLQTNAAAVAIAGTGTVRLNANAGNLDTAQMNTTNGGNVLTNGANQTIAGTGRIRVNTINNGLIRADVDGAVLDLAQFGKSNNNLIEAVGGGDLSISGIAMANANGLIRADGAGSVVHYNSSGVTGGTLTAQNGSLGQVRDSTFSNLTVNGPHEVVAGNTLAYSGDGITNNGVITVNHNAGNLTTAFRADALAVTVGGTGTIRLNAFSGNVDTAQMNSINGGFALTLSANQTVDGTGSIRVLATNNGLIDANVAGRAIALRQFAKTNNGTMRARNGGTLSFEGVSVANANGQIVADGAGSLAAYSGTAVTGGTVAATNGASGSVSDSTFNGLTLSGPHQVVSGSTLAVAGPGITNNGLITVNHNAANLTCALRNDADGTTIGGTGTVRLNANVNNLDTAQFSSINGNFVMTTGPSHTVDGTGSIRLNLISNGLIDANVTGRAIALRQFPKTNNGTMRSRNGGTLSFEGIQVANANGQIVADGAGSTAVYGSSGITGGSVSAINGGLGAIANSTFSNLALSGPHQVNSGTVLAIAGSGITNNGSIVVNHDGANLSTQFRLDVLAATIGGTGLVQLNANPANLDTAQMNTLNGNFVLTMGPDQTLTGLGRIRVNMVNQGTISPGSAGTPVGRIEPVQFPFALEDTATYAVDVGGTGAGQFDQILGSIPTTLDGTLQVSLINGYVPIQGHDFVIVSTSGARTGEFRDIVAPNPGPGNAWRVRYDNLAGQNRAVLAVTCPEDLNGDHSVGLSDLTILLSNYGITSGAGGEDGDIQPGPDGDGDVDISDLTTLLSAFGSTCP